MRGKSACSACEVRIGCGQLLRSHPLPKRAHIRATLGGLAVVISVALVACGGDREDDAAGPADPEAALECIEEAGLDASLTPIEDASTGVTSYLNVDATKKDGVEIAYFEDAASASAFVEAQRQAAAVDLNPNDTTLEFPTVSVTTYSVKVDPEREIVVACL
jgi:hypothetical protein